MNTEKAMDRIAAALILTAALITLGMLGVGLIAMVKHVFGGCP